MILKGIFKNLLDNEIEIVRQPSKEEYGTVAVFKDIYGNLWDLIGNQHIWAKARTFIMRLLKTLSLKAGVSERKLNHGL